MISRRFELVAKRLDCLAASFLNDIDGVLIRDTDAGFMSRQVDC
jgi:hypothetical protein